MFWQHPKLKEKFLLMSHTVVTDLIASGIGLLNAVKSEGLVLYIILLTASHKRSQMTSKKSVNNNTLIEDLFVKIGEGKEQNMLSFSLDNAKK